MTGPRIGSDVSLAWRYDTDIPLTALPDMYRAGATLRQLEVRAGYSIRTIQATLRAAGVEMRPPNRRGTRNRSSWWHEKAAALRAQGYTYPVIAERFGVVPYTVCQALRRLAAAPPPPGPIDPPLDYPVTSMGEAEP